MPLIGNSIEPEKAGKSGVNNRIYQSFYSISEKIYIARPERMSLSTGPLWDSPFIDYIMVSKKQVINGKTVYPIDIYYNGVGIITAPSAEEYEEMFQERLKLKRTKEQKTA